MARVISFQEYKTKKLDQQYPVVTLFYSERQQLGWIEDLDPALTFSGTIDQILADMSNTIPLSEVVVDIRFV